MISEMIGHTKRLAFKLALSVALFALLATSLAVLHRYGETLKKLRGNHQSIIQNLTQMRMTTLELLNSIASFKRMLPAGYESRSPELMLYTRLDEAKTKLPPGELLVKPLETRDGMISVEFQFKQENPSYSNLLNTIGTLESVVFPFVTIKTINIGGDSTNKSGAISLTLTGEIATQAPPQAEAATPAPQPTPTVPKGAR